ncbi:SURF1 family protein [Candidatus Colwellia aromaticivorans]|uniref:SURF1 family protein n=1 Tax=Candidatus Colwellia aromaticivorans TaxID=2267621 RepID=UPI000DF3FA8A|nr:SURF1 family protein [Candidatus Colwellia aromaticivorans]
MNILWLLLTVLVFSALVKLGFWQSSRALEKEQRLSRIDQLKSKNPLSLQQVNLLTMNENINDMPVAIEGEFDEHAVFLLDNQVNNGRLGYRVYQVLITEQYAVLVNLGWVQGSVNRQELPKIKSLSDKHYVHGNVRLIEVGIQLQEQVFSDVQWPLRIQQVELDKFSSLINRQLLPFVIYLDKKEDIGFEKNWQPIVMPPEKHRAYAFQWFSLAIAWIMLMGWARFGARKTSENNQNNNLKKSSPLKKEA